MWGSRRKMVCRSFCSEHTHKQGLFCFYYVVENELSVGFYRTYSSIGNNWTRSIVKEKRRRKAKAPNSLT
jgi:hypothetical protein